MKHTLVLLLSIILISSTVQAQGEYNLWTRATIGYKTNSKLLVDSEIQYRKQNAERNNVHPNTSLLKSIRFWVHQELTPNLQLSLSPFAYLHHSQLIGHVEDEIAHSKEIRFSTALIAKKKFSQKWQLQNRTALESRHWLNEDKYALRARNRLGVKYSIWDHLSVSVSEELLVLPVGRKEKSWIDHNRIMGTVDIQLSGNLKTELGYIFIHRYKSTSNAFRQEHVAMLNVYYMI